jgi:hypothetical protein
MKSMVKRSCGIKAFGELPHQASPLILLKRAPDNSTRREFVTFPKENEGERVPKAQPKIELRERGIYKLPDAREFVVRRSGDGYGYLLFNTETWRRYTSADYRAEESGRVLSRGVVTRWRVCDLVDTGRTARA